MGIHTAIKTAWTRESVEAYLVEATWTLRRLPDPEHQYLHGSGAAWVGYIKDKQTDYACEATVLEQRLRHRPSAAEIDRYPLILKWLEILPIKGRVRADKVVFWSCWHLDGHPRGYGEKFQDGHWERVSNQLPRSASARHLRREYNAALDMIAAWLNQQEG